MTFAVLSIGSNIGDREFFIAEAIRRLEKNEHITNLVRSGLYETDPVGYTDQDSFYNAVVGIDTDLAPEELLDYINGIEKDLGRVRTVRWGPRTIDIDIILYGDEVINTPRLTVPHPRYKERAFVTVPMEDLGIFTEDAVFGEDQGIKKIEWKEEI
ncbi:MAG: 2-amino-4-hydroxy-6-hydroxymethyldihydropteridine diphosphokinase [Clostridiales bacterium]|nr:2-amino-4-hydroxy-6-hydroxymethyldihydropteridine diphosphokinase [Clostridiales bacterium]